MARRRNTIAKKVTFDMNEMAARVYGMTDEELGKWMHKAIKDCIEGCVDPDTDCFVKRMYEESYGKMQQKQIIDANTYRNRLARQNNSGKPNHDKTNDPVLTTPSASGSCATFATTPLSPISTDKTDSGAQSVKGTPDNAAPASNLLQLDTSKKPYGTCGHVMLTDAEGHHLREVYGENLKTAIDILDAYIENNGKAAKKYKNHAAVLRKGNWVYEKVQNMILAQKRIDNVGNNHKSFKQMDRDERTRFFFDTSVVDRMIDNESSAM